MKEMELFELKFTIQENILQMEPEEVTLKVYEAKIPHEAQEQIRSCRYLGLAVGMPYGFQLYTKEQWEDLHRRVGTFPSIMQRHMRPFFTTMTLLDSEDETEGFPQVLSVSKSLGGYAKIEEWPTKEDGLSALLALLEDGRIYILRSDEKEEFIKTFCEEA